MYEYTIPAIVIPVYMAIHFAIFWTNRKWIQASKTGKTVFHMGDMYIVRPPVPCACNICGTGHKPETRDAITKALDKHIMDEVIKAVKK